MLFRRSKRQGDRKGRSGRCVQYFKSERKKGRTKAGAEAESRDTEGRSECSKGRAEGAGDSSKPSALTFKGELAWPAAEEGKAIMNYSMDQTVYFKSLDQYRYNPAVIIGAKVNDKVTSAQPEVF